MLETLCRCEVTTLCAPTVWRMLIQQDLRSYPIKLRELVGAGEPPNLNGPSAARYQVVLLDAEGQPAAEGEIGLTLNPRAVGLMSAYEDDPTKTAEGTAWSRCSPGRCRLPTRGEPVQILRALNHASQCRIWCCRPGAEPRSE